MSRAERHSPSRDTVVDIVVCVVVGSIVFALMLLAGTAM